MNVYGIGNCDTCRKARRWLDEAGVTYDWVDLRANPPGRKTLGRWLEQLGRERLLNRRSKTWRDLADQERDRAATDEGALGLIEAHPTLIKRPIIDTGEAVLVGFTNDTERTLLELP